MCINEREIFGGCGATVEANASIDTSTSRSRSTRSPATTKAASGKVPGRLVGSPSGRVSTFSNGRRYVSTDADSVCTSSSDVIIVDAGEHRADDSDHWEAVDERSQQWKEEQEQEQRLVFADAINCSTDANVPACSTSSHTGHKSKLVMAKSGTVARTKAVVMATINRVGDAMYRVSQYVSQQYQNSSPIVAAVDKRKEKPQPKVIGDPLFGGRVVHRTFADLLASHPYLSTFYPYQGSVDFSRRLAVYTPVLGAAVGGVLRIARSATSPFLAVAGGTGGLLGGTFGAWLGALGFASSVSSSRGTNCNHKKHETEEETTKDEEEAEEEEDDEMEFYLPRITDRKSHCTYGEIVTQNDNQPARKSSVNEYALENILRPWQAQFLATVGITTVQQLLRLTDSERRRERIAKAMKKFRNKTVPDKPPVKTAACAIALHVWIKTCSTALKNEQDGGPTIPNFLDISFSSKDGVDDADRGSTAMSTIDGTSDESINEIGAEAEEGQAAADAPIVY